MSSKIDQPEHRLSHHVRELIERIVAEPHVATAVDTGTYMHSASQAQRFAREEHRKWMGITPHHLDWYLYGCTSRIYTQFELKYGGNDTSDNQDVTIGRLRERGIPCGTFRSVDEVYRHLRAAGFRMHGNAENIAYETELRWRAADEAARGPATAKRKTGRSSRPRAPKPSAAAVARGIRMGSLRP